MPSLATPPPLAADQANPPFASRYDHDIFSLMPVMPPNGSTTSNTFGLDGTMADPRPPLPQTVPAIDGATNPSPPANTAEPNGTHAEQARDNDAQESSSEDEGEDSEDDEGSRRSNMDRSWYEIFEEKREPVEDELRYWKETEEHSATDHGYWECKAFTDLEDSDLQPGTSGRIDFAIDRFNGTREKPNKETVMRSHTVDIGGYTWRLKLYPKGNNTDHLSAYLENVTMQAAEWAVTEEFADPPLPFLANAKEKPRKRRSVAAQVCVVVYNPKEPRQYEHKVDAHQFSKDSPDYGWTRFTHMRRRDLGLRNHFQRAPLLQDDKLAFKAYIRLIDDPTGCLWDHASGRFSSVVSSTGLRPFSPMLPMLAADLVLLHFRPIQELVCKWQQEKDSSKFASWMNILLWKMLSRERSELYGEPVECEQSDVVAWMQRAVKHLREEEGEEVTRELVGSMDTASGRAAVGGHRLETRTHASVQAAVRTRDSTLDTPALLALELERQHFDKEKREWSRITDKVDMENEITVGDKRYQLFAFVTHCGELASNNFNSYIRPRGLGTMWYGYSHDRVTCMTHKQALDKRCGSDESSSGKLDKSFFSFGRDRRGTQGLRDDQEVTHAVFYVREDYANHAFSQPREIDWTPPGYVTGVKASEETTGASHEMPVVEEKEVPQDTSLKRASIASQDSDYIAGCATPTHWLMDEDGDVVMSDHEDDSADKTAEDEEMAKVASNEPEVVHRTLDHLGCSYYSGQMVGSKYNGQGHLITLNGDEYEGSFSHGSKHGTGKMTYASNGDIYEGEWADGERHGSGKYIEASTGNVFDGSWKHDKKSGQFTLTGTVTEEDKGICGICYEREINTAFYDCGHVVACHACAQQIEDCPVCRRRIVSRLQLFGVKVSLE